MAHNMKRRCYPNGHTVSIRWIATTASHVYVCQRPTEESLAIDQVRIFTSTLAAHVRHAAMACAECKRYLTRSNDYISFGIPLGMPGMPLVGTMITPQAIRAPELPLGCVA